MRLAEPAIDVQSEMPLVLEDERGRRRYLPGGHDGVWETIPVSLYRRYAWQGLLRRWLVRVKGYGREYWIDEGWRRRQAAAGNLVQVERVLGPQPARRGCGGCGSR